MSDEAKSKVIVRIGKLIQWWLDRPHLARAKQRIEKLRNEARRLGIHDEVCGWLDWNQNLSEQHRSELLAGA